jgi:UDP-glucose 4-epimerase
LFADASKVHRELGWKARWTDIHDIVSTAWKWFRDHPKGYL